MASLRKALILGFGLSLLAASQAAARRTVIDVGEFLPQGSLGAGCTIGGAACDPTLLPFFFDFGTGSTNQAYIYDRGIISFGAPIPNVVDPNGSFTSFGVPVIAPLYVPGSSGNPGPYQVGTATIGPDDFVETLPNFGTDLFLIQFMDPTTFDQENDLSAIINVIFDFSATELRIEFIHGMSRLGFDEEGNFGVLFALPDPTGTQMGYLVNGQQFFAGGATTPDIIGNNAWSIFAPNAVPDPRTWLTMLLGFGLTGMAIRRERQLRAQPA
jgi:hypothetical protein